MPTVLLTGANGFVASQILSDLFTRGFTTIGTVRTPEKAAEILAFNPAYRDTDRVRLLVVPDFTAPGCWDAAFADPKGIDYVIHTAAPVPDQLDAEKDEFERDFLEPGVKGNLELLKAAEKSGSVKHITFTGSVVAAAAPPKDRPEDRADNGSWNSITKEDAKSMKNLWINYRANKKYQELAIWDHLKTASPPFTVTVLLPTVILGPALQPISSMSGRINFTTSIIYNHINGRFSDFHDIPITSMQHWTSLISLSAAHIDSLTLPAARNKRFIFGTGWFNRPMISEVIRRRFPELAVRCVCKGGEEDELPRWNLQDQETREVFGEEKYTFEDVVVQAVERLVELEGRVGK